jgi:hypothetical protein
MVDSAFGQYRASDCVVRLMLLRPATQFVTASLPLRGEREGVPAMSFSTVCGPTARLRRWALAVLSSIAFLAPAGAAAFTLTVVDANGVPLSTGYKWLVEEDATRFSEPGVSTPADLALNFHRSYMPVAARGDSSNTDIALDPAKRYFVSVVPDAGYSIGGAPVAPGQQSVTVVVDAHPIPTAQITVLVFEDNFPINNAPDEPAERGLEGFEVILEDPGGRYGQVGGQVTQDAFGNPLGTIRSGPDGTVTIKNLSPGKYGVIVIPPPGQDWQQTSTIEGTIVVDAWVKANEPAFFQEFGPPGPHVFTGFVRPFADATRLAGGSTVSGKVVNDHLARPPDYAFFNGATFEHTTCWVGLNEGANGAGRGIYAARCNPDNSFEIPNVPPGDYQLVVWDDNMDLIFTFLGFTVPPGGAPVVFGDVPVFNWFTGLHQYVFNDENENGIWEPELGESGLSDVPTNIRFRDGTVYQSFPTDMEGLAPFDEVFPFFNWLVAEVDYTRYKATGATVVVDAGGPIDGNDPWTFGGILNPQAQPDNGGLPYRVETGPVLTQGFQGFLGQTSVIQWGKKAYGPGENGGISGVVYYAVTRAEDDPQLAAVEPWEPGIPRVQVNLYRDADALGTIFDANGNGQLDLADVDNHPFGWKDGGPKGPEDVDRNGDPDTFDPGDALQITYTDSWDDSVPTACPGNPLDPFFFPDEDGAGRCYDGMRNWNQVRPGVFDGGYAFGDLAPDIYVVEAVPPRSAYGVTYEIVKEEDKNVDFGDEYVSAANIPVACVGDLRPVPEFLSLFPGKQIPTAYGGQERPLCDRKQVWLTDGINAAADFPMFTPVPIAGHIVGFVLDDLATEFDRASPQFGEKFAIPWIPISVRDWTGREISRVYTDSFGTYNALVPSTYTMDRPMPTGVAPNMITVCLNDPARPDPTNPSGFVRDPFYKPQYSQFCYTFQYTPGTTTYLDTPVVHVAAFAGANQFPLDCELGNGTPRIHSVSGPRGGPWVETAGQQLTILSMGDVEVPNPMFDPAAVPPSPANIVRDYGFGSTQGTVTLPNATGTAKVPLTIVSWSPGMIVATVPPGAATGQLEITRGDNQKATTTGVTVTVARIPVFQVPPGGKIQDVIDSPLVPPGSLVLVPPGNYEEVVILWKPLRLQGWGEGSTLIDAVKAPAEKLQIWRQDVEAIVTSGAVDLLPGQESTFGGMEPGTLFNEEGAGILVLARNVNVNQGGFGLVGGKPNARIDGFTITGADHGGGVVVNGYAHYMQISNNRFFGNAGVYGGAVRVGHPLEAEVETSFNDHVSIFANQIIANGGERGAGGGISLYTGSDAYVVRDNHVCGNFSMGEGGGIGHLGYSPGGLIEGNTIVFNQSFNQQFTVSGGGIVIAGEQLPAPGLSPGSGSVRIQRNLIRGNQAGAGDGGGVSLARVSGADVDQNGNQPTQWNHVELYNNFITNNIAALAGGGVALQDAPRVTMVHNTIAHNDSTGTAGAAFTPGNPSVSTAQPAGVVSRAHSPELAAQFGNSPNATPYRVFSNPTMNGNIVWENRSFFFSVDDAVDPPTYALLPRAASPYWDLGVLGAPGALVPRYSVLTDAAGTHSTNVTGAACTTGGPTQMCFRAEYQNGSRGVVPAPDVTTPLTPAAAFDEGGNFIDLIFGPLTLWDPETGALLGDYHISAPNRAIGVGDPALLRFYPQAATDYDRQLRPQPAGSRPDAGADEIP